jgi:hypothetical protein
MQLELSKCIVNETEIILACFIFFKYQLSVTTCIALRLTQIIPVNSSSAATNPQ